MIAEEWRAVEGWPLYEVSSLGRVRSWNTRCGGGGGRILHQQVERRNGYIRVCLYPAKRTVRVNVLVLEAFHGRRPSPNHEAAHWDDDKKNNTVANLRWATSLENKADRDRNGRTARGVRHGQAKLTENDAAEIYRLAKLPGADAKAIGARFGVTRQMVAYIRDGRLWRQVTEAVSSDLGEAEEHECRGRFDLTGSPGTGSPGRGSSHLPPGGSTPI